MGRENDLKQYQFDRKKHELSNHEEEVRDKTLIALPLGVELFSAGVDAASTLPPEIMNDPRYQEQVARRRSLYTTVTHVFDAIPDQTMDINQAVGEGLVDATTTARLWDSVTDFLDQDENNARLLLYFPFEILPNMHGGISVSEDMRSSGQRLSESCRVGWIRILHETEPRANFVDGDILEPGLGEPERVSKAGHLTPELVARDIIDGGDVLTLLEIISDTTLLRSLAEGAVVAHERGLLDRSTWTKAEDLIVAKLGGLPSDTTKNKDYNDPNSPRISPARVAWLRKVSKEAQEEKAADQQAQEIVTAVRRGDQIAQRELEMKTLKAVFKAGKLLQNDDLGEAREFSSSSLALIQEAWESDDASVKNAVVGGLHHWVRQGVVDENFLQHFGISLTDLSAPSQLTEEDIREKFQDFTHAAQTINAHPFLSQTLYPGFLVFGSRVKGYAGIDADLDAAIFMRPEANLADRQQMLEVLRSDVPELASIDKPVEYWTEREAGKMRLKTVKKGTRIFGGEEQIHFLLGGAWIGAGEELLEVRNDLLRRYVDLSRLGADKDFIRQRLLGQLELDMLQYRLVHKGYRKFYPTVARERTPKDELIDAESDFWDPGYRRVATKLFVSRVFLPDLSKD